MKYPYLSIVLFILMNVVFSLNVDWIPNDANAPLPLSKAYRDRLRKLCVLTRSPSARVSAEIEAKRGTITALCAKLKADDDNIAAAGEEVGQQQMNLLKKSLLTLVVVLGVLTYLSENTIWGKKIWDGIRQNVSGWDVPSSNPYEYSGGGKGKGGFNVKADTEEQRRAKAFLAQQRWARFGPSNAATATADTSTTTMQADRQGEQEMTPAILYAMAKAEVKAEMKAELQAEAEREKMKNGKHL